jgi:hypothetical protein
MDTQTGNQPRERLRSVLQHYKTVQAEMKKLSKRLCGGGAKMMFVLWKDAAEKCAVASAGEGRRTLEQYRSSILHWQGVYDRLPRSDLEKMHFATVYEQIKQDRRRAAPLRKDNACLEEVLARLEASQSNVSSGYAQHAGTILGMGCRQYPLAPTFIEQVQAEVGTSLRGMCLA